ncbi:MAG: hypothetical protein ABI897_12210 [Spartobacteria bacterium]
MQTTTLVSNTRYGQVLDKQTSLRLRAFRFLSERYTQRERPTVAAEFTLFALIILLSSWPMFTLAHVMSLHRW